MITLAVALALAVPHMDLTCTLSPGEKKMSIACSIQFPAGAVKKDRFEFDLGEPMSEPTVKLIQADGPEDLPVKKGLTADQVTHYSVPLQATGKPVTLRFEYQSRSPKGNVYFLDPRTCFCGGYNTLWFPEVDDSRRMVGSMKFIGPSDFVVKASGRETGTETKNNVRSTTFQIEQPTVPTFAAAPYHVTKLPGKVPVTLYFLKERPGADKFAAGFAAILSVLEREFGPYPYPDFAIIETPSPESSSLGFTGASFEGFMFGDTNSMDADFNLAYFGHEMSHQWWGNLVQTKGDKGSYVMSEALAQFGSLQAVRQIDGVELAKQYRTSGYPGYSDWQCLSGALAYVATGNDHLLSQGEGGEPMLHHQLANSKGFLAWETLAEAMGHDAFRAALHDVTKKYAWSSLTWDELWVALQHRTKLDLTTFRNEWFERPGLPVVWTTWNQTGDAITVDLHQSNPLYHLHMPLVLTFKDGATKRRNVDFDTESASVTIKDTRSLLSAELDPNHETLHSTPKLRDRAKALQTYEQVDFFDSLLGKRLERNQALIDALDNLPKPDKYGVEFHLRFTLGGNLRTQGKLKEAREQLERALACPVRNDDFVPLAYLRLAIIANAEKQPDQVKRYLQEMQASESKLTYPSGAIGRAKTLFPDYRW